MQNQMTAKGKPTYGDMPVDVLRSGFFFLASDSTCKVFYGTSKDNCSPTVCHVVLEDGALVEEEAKLDHKATIMILSGVDLGIKDTRWVSSSRP